MKQQLTDEHYLLRYKKLAEDTGGYSPQHNCVAVIYANKAAESKTSSSDE